MNHQPKIEKFDSQLVPISIPLLFLGFFLFLQIGSASSMTTNDEPIPPQIQLRTYALHNNPRSVDISPDEKLVPTICTLEKDQAGSNNLFIETVQLWDFREDKLIAGTELKRTEGEKSKNGKFYRS